MNFQSPKIKDLVKVSSLSQLISVMIDGTTGESPTGVLSGIATISALWKMNKNWNYSLTQHGHHQRKYDMHSKKNMKMQTYNGFMMNQEWNLQVTYNEQIRSYRRW